MGANENHSRRSDILAKLAINSVRSESQLNKNRTLSLGFSKSSIEQAARHQVRLDSGDSTILSPDLGYKTIGKTCLPHSGFIQFLIPASLPELELR